MEIEITRQVLHTEVIDVELPYYYMYDLMSDYADSVIYGKIEENLHTSIHEIETNDGEKRYEIEKEEHTSIKNSGLASYFDKKHVSSKKEFEDVKERCMLFLNTIK